jgi:hypothetical protein
MLTVEDCIALCGLTEDEVAAIAHHEHIPQAAAAELANYLAQTGEGELCLKAMIRDDIAAAASAGDSGRVLALKLMLRDFVLQHPRCDERTRRELHLPERRSA